MGLTRWRGASVLLAVAVATLIVRDALASSTTTIAEGNAVAQVKIVRHTQSDCPIPCTSGPEALVSRTWTDVPGATTSITVPPNTQAIILVRSRAAGIAPTTARRACSG
jgi:hypothetical protein